MSEIHFFQGLTPYEFVEGMKKKGIRVPGIGHRYMCFTTVYDMMCVLVMANVSSVLLEWTCTSHAISIFRYYNDLVKCMHSWTC